MIKKSILTSLLFLMVLFLPSCMKQFTKESFSAPQHMSLYIEMPDNKLVFENISSLVYESLWHHLNRVGYRISDTKKDSYSLQILVKKVDSSHKFFSPDLLTYAAKTKIELSCKLFDEKNILISQKEFAFATLISKAKDYVVNSKFTDFEYRRLLERHVYKIEHYFRPYFLKK